MPAWSLAAVVALGAGHVAARYWPAPRLAGVLKPLPVALLAGVVAAAPGPEPAAYRWAVVAALVCSMAGDVLLLSRARFVPGLTAFLVAHLCYLVAFVPGGGWGPAVWLLLAPFLAVAGAMLRVLWPHLGAHRGPVVAYLLVIAAMGWRAAVRAAALGDASGGLALAGAALFMTSDGILAVDRFAHPFRSANAAVMVTYYAAQTLIAASALV
jgi:uncharacterized membrane protein YhhN